MSTISLPLSNHLDLFGRRLAQDRQVLSRRSLGTLQLNIGKMCNLACHHCHVEAGPKRTEIMTWETMSQVLGWIDTYGDQIGLTTLDLTGGAPEMNPDFRRFVLAARERNLKVMDRCNLTILLEPGYENLIDFLASNQVEIVASLPCYLEDNVDKQRGRGVFQDSVEALRRLNRVGYGTSEGGLRLSLVYNPTGYGLPPAQGALEADYKRELRNRYGIEFDRLFTITNMPIKRFAHALHRDGKYDLYLGKLMAAHNPANTEHVMCRELVSVGWQGSVYDCDFNQMLQMALEGPGGEEQRVEAESRKLWEFTPEELLGRGIATGSHCFGCTAGAGSSCTGSLG